jgi:hypothetical protein
MNSTHDVLKAILLEHFMYNNYIKAIVMLRNNIHGKHNYSIYWEELKKMIRDKQFENGQPLQLIHNYANLALDENSDEEAYKWLDLMIKNTELKEGEEIIPY